MTVLALFVSATFLNAEERLKSYLAGYEKAASKLDPPLPQDVGRNNKSCKFTVYNPFSRYYNQYRRGKRDVIGPQLVQELISLGAYILSWSITYPPDNAKSASAQKHK